MNFSKHLRKLRIKDGLTQGNLAKKLGVTTQCVSQMELGIHIPSFKVYEKIVRAFSDTRTTEEVEEIFLYMRNALVDKWRKR